MIVILGYVLCARYFNYLKQAIDCSTLVFTRSGLIVHREKPIAQRVHPIAV